MKKFLSIFVALAMVLSLFAGVGARSAKAATTYPFVFNTGASTSNGTVGWSMAENHTTSGTWSVAMTVPDPATDKAEIVFTPSATTLLSEVDMAQTSFWTKSANTNTPYIIVDFTDGTNHFSINTTETGQTADTWQQYVAATAGSTWQLSTDDGWYSLSALLTQFGSWTVEDIIVEGTESGTTHNLIAYVDDVVIDGVASLSEFITAPPVRTLQSIAVTPAIVTAAVGATQQFVATGTYNLAPLTADITSSVTWTSGIPATGTIGAATGLFTAIAVGSSTVTATLAPGTVGTAVVTVDTTARTLASIAVTPATPTVAVGATQQFVATGTYTSAPMTADITSSVVWTSGIPATGTIGAATGLFTAIAVGSSTVTATLGAVFGTATVTVTTAPTLSSILQALKALYKKIGDTAKLIRDEVKAAKAAHTDLTTFAADLKTAQKYATHRAVSHGIMLTEVERAKLETMQTSIHKLEQDLKTLRKIKTPKATKATLDLFRAQIKTAIAARTAYLKTIHTAALTQYSSRLVTLIADANMKLTFLQTLLTKLTNLL